MPATDIRISLDVGHWATVILGQWPLYHFEDSDRLKELHIEARLFLMTVTVEPTFNITWDQTKWWQNMSQSCNRKTLEFILYYSYMEFDYFWEQIYRPDCRSRFSLMTREKSSIYMTMMGNLMWKDSLSIYINFFGVILMCIFYYNFTLITSF